MKLDKATVDSLYLFSHSPDHSIYTISEFTSFLVVPLLHEKARLIYEGDKPMGVVTWCWLTKDEAQKFLDDQFVPDEENYARGSGEQLWGIEFIAPFGHARQVMREMRHHSKRLYGSGVTVHWRRLHSPTKVHARRF